MKSEVQLIPSLEEDPDQIDLREALNKSLLWRSLDDDERKVVIIGDITLGQKRRSTLKDWVIVGHAIHLLDREIFKRCGAHAGKAYNKLWGDLTPNNLKLISPRDRTHSRWLYDNKEIIETWWETVPKNNQDKWGHPATIKSHYKQDVDFPQDIDDNDEPKQNSERKQSATDRLEEHVDRLGEIMTGIASPDLHFDFSTVELTVESINHFWEFYGSQFNQETLTIVIDYLKQRRDAIS